MLRSKLLLPVSLVLLGACSSIAGPDNTSAAAAATLRRDGTDPTTGATGGTPTTNPGNGTLGSGYSASSSENNGTLGSGY